MTTVVTTTPSRKRKPASSRRLFTVKSTKRRRVAVVRPMRMSMITRGPIPKRTVIKLKYFEGITFANGGTTFDYQFRLNSIYDPNYTGTGHQPYGYDQYNTFYNRYRVHRVDYVIGAAVVASNVNGTAKVTLVHNNDSTSYGNPNLAAESPLSTTKIVAGGTPVYFVGSIKPENVCGVTPTEYKDDRFGAAFGANPTEVIHMHLVASVGDNTALADSAIFYNVQLTYTCEFSDRFNLNQS